MNQNPNPTRYLSARQLARRLGKSPTAVHFAIRFNNLIPDAIVDNASRDSQLFLDTPERVEAARVIIEAPPAKYPPFQDWARCTVDGEADAAIANGTAPAPAPESADAFLDRIINAGKEAK